MEYDIDIHLPQLIDNFEKAYIDGNLELLENIQTMLKKHLPSLEKTIKQCEQIRLQQKNKTCKKYLENLTKKAQEALQILTETQNPDELYIDLAEIQNDLTNGLMEAEKDYWETIHAKALKTIQDTEP